MTRVIKPQILMKPCGEATELTLTHFMENL